MSGYASDDLARTLGDLEEQLSGKRSMSKALDDVREDMDGLRDRMQAHHERDARIAGSHEAQLQELRGLVQDLGRRGVSTADVKAMLSKMWDDLHQALEDGREEERRVDPVAEANKNLTKSVVSFLSDNPSRAEVEQTTLWVYKSFGRSGGKRIPYNKELAGRLLLSKAISPQEHENWKRYDRLPDDVTSQSAGRAKT